MKRISTLELITEARQWVGTPYVPQARKKLVGCDCVGLFAGLAEHFKIGFVYDHIYPETPSGESLLRYLNLNLSQLFPTTMEETLPGSILALKTRSDPGPHHLVLRTYTGMLHAWGRNNQRQGKVIEHGLMWPDTLHSIWWHPEVF